MIRNASLRWSGGPLQVNALATMLITTLITLLVFFSVAVSCDRVTMSRSWFLLVSVLSLGSLTSFFLRCHSLPSHFCGHMNATAFFLCQNKTWINATVNIFSASAVCDYARRWLFLSCFSGARREIRLFSFRGEDACWHRNVLSFLWSFVRHVFFFLFVLWQHFVGFAFFTFTVGGVRGCPIAEGALLSYRRPGRG